MTRLIIILTMLTAFCSLGCFGQTDNDTLIFGLKNSVLFKETIFDGYTHIERYTPKHIKADIQPEFRIKLESQYGITIRAKINGTKYYNVPICTFDSYNIDPEYGDQINKCFLQIGEHDFNKDGIAEIIIAFGVRGEYLDCKIYQYYEPASLADADREENWKLISDFYEVGHYNILNFPEVDDNKIFFPYGLRGLRTGFIYIDRRFVEF